MASQADLARELLGLAKDDEAAARAMLENDSVTDAIVGFHCQQAVEKSLKAVLAASGSEFPFSHDLSGLSELCEAGGTPVPAELEHVDRLTPYGARFRYGGPDPSTVDRRSAQRWAAVAVAWAATHVEAQRE
jgi:HEPN domain-containing protein